ncbi:MAG: hypothetical protein IIY21_23120 [Clostridiales bacterium]|nr:hypothetical protein [Clostridiales bacterium]
MTREYANFILANIDRRVCDAELSEALDMAIKALSAEPCEDCISRQAAIDVVHEYFEKYLNLNDDICLDGIRSLPSVTPEQKMGHWINYQKNIWIYAQCSECGTVHDTKTNYCPNCGAKMVEPQESEDNE